MNVWLIMQQASATPLAVLAKMEGMGMQMDIPALISQKAKLGECLDKVRA